MYIISEVTVYRFGFYISERGIELKYVYSQKIEPLFLNPFLLRISFNFFNFDKKNKEVIINICFLFFDILLNVSCTNYKYLCSQ